MTSATWRVNRTDHAGQRMAPLDYTSKTQAVENVHAARRLGTAAELQRWNEFTGEWADQEVPQ